LAHRRVLPDERPALLAVAGVAELVHAIGFEERPGDRAVGIVAIAAGHFPLEQRHVRALAELGALLLVAGKAGLASSRLREQAGGREPGHRIVAVGAAQAPRLLGGAVTEKSLPALCARVA